MKTLSGLLTAIVALGLFTACSSAGADLEEAPITRADRVVVDDMRFSPRVIEVTAGTTVSWSFQGGDMRHDVKGDGFKSEIMRTGTFWHAFSAPGVYDYHCTLHPQMTGRIVVTS